MYRRVVVNFCSSVDVERFSTVMVENNDIAVKTSYSYISVTDIALTNCYLVAHQRKVLGSIAVGKVIDRGVNIRDIYEGSKVIVYAIQSPRYLYTLGGAQDVVVIEHENTVVAEPKDYKDLELLIIATLSIKKELIDDIKGKDVLLIGEDISLTSFAYYTSKYSCRIGVVPKCFPYTDIVKGEHISLYNTNRFFDVVVVATSDPLCVCLALKKLAKYENSMAILYPYTYNILGGLCLRNNIRFRTIVFGDISTGIEVFEAYKNLIVNKLNVVNVDRLPKKISKPLLIEFS